MIRRAKVAWNDPQLLLSVLSEKLSRAHHTTNNILSNMIFTVDLVREKILDYLLHNGRPSDLILLRQVCPMWLSYISKKSLKSGRSLFLLDLTDTNMISPTLSGLFQNKLMSQFISEFGSSQESPPLQVKLDGNFFIHENYTICRQLFSKFGPSMVTLWIHLGANSLPFLLPNLELPHLHKFDCHVVSSSNSPQFNHEPTTYLIQSILSASFHLRKVSFIYDAPQNISSSFGFLDFPVTLQEICLSCPFTLDDFNRLILNSPLNNVRSLKLLQFGEHLLANGVISRILEKFAGSLEELQLELVSPGIRPLFPVRMEEVVIPEVNLLKVLKFENFVANVTNPEGLRNVTNLKLGWTTEEILERWRGGVYPAVERFQVEIVDGRSHPLQYEDLSLDKVQLIKDAFPGLKSLQVRFVGEEMPGLEGIFEKFGRLTELEITFSGYGRNFNEPWLTSKLLGISVEQAKKVRVGGTVELKKGKPSITNLSELKSLSIQTARYFGPQRSSLMSDLAFQEGFMKLKNLTKLQLRGEVEPSKEQWIRWKTHLASIPDVIKTKS